LAIVNAADAPTELSATRFLVVHGATMAPIDIGRAAASMQRANRINSDVFHRPHGPISAP